MDRAVVLLSGGVGSAVAAAAAREQYELALMHVAWGHRSAEREMAAFEQLSGWIKTEKLMITDLSFVASFGGNARVSRRMNIESTAGGARETPATFAMGLLPSMLSVAVAWAAGLGARRIILGIGENQEASGPAIGDLYPDHRREFVQAYNLMLETAKPATRQLIVETPLMDLTRAEVVSLGRKLKVPFDKTWSCYRNNDNPCGKCRACVTRVTGFLKAGVPDPLVLELATAGKK